MINTEKLCMGCMNDNDGEQICPICGYDASLQNHIQALPVRFVLANRYIVGKTLSVNGEGIVYIGWDKATDSAVKIKEYLPLGIAVRNPDATVSIVADKKYVFNEGLLEFLEINRTIMSKQLPSLQEVEDVFETNCTAYTVYHNIQGIPLSDFLERNGGTLKWEQARALVLPLIDTIKAMDDMGITHKAISPETVIVGRDGKLRITDYSINRLRLSDADIEPELYDGYAAAEQYGIMDMKAGTYTDVYGLCATIFRMLIGMVIPKATLRMEDASLSIPAKFAEELPRHVLAALANGLKVKPDERTQDIDTLKNELVYGEITEAPKATEKAEVVSSKSAKKEKKKGKSGAKYVVASAGITVAVFLILGLVLYFVWFKGDAKDNESLPSDDSIVVSVPEQEDGTQKYEDLPVKTYTVPNFAGKTYSEVIDNDENEVFIISIKNAEYSSKYAKGQICKQSVKKGSKVEKETKIELTISLGPKEFKIPNVVGLDEQTAKLELLKAGFLYENIEVLEKYDENSEPGKILEQSPEFGTKVNSFVVVKIYKNTYEGEEPMGGGDDQQILDEYQNETSW